MANPQTIATEPCLACGDETAVGSVLYSDRFPVDQPTGQRVYICGYCRDRIRDSKKGAPLTDQEFRDMANNAAMAGVGLLGGGR